MAQLRVLHGDATQPQGEGNAIIVHICNDVGGWGKGFVLALSKRWSAPETAFRAWYRGQAEGAPPHELGAVQLVEVEEGLFVANLIGQHKLKKTPEGPPVRYRAIQEGLARCRTHALENNASVHMPRIGCGLAGGRWEMIEPLVMTELVDHGVEVTVYDWP